MNNITVESRDKGKRWTGRIKLKETISREEALRRWPRLTAHMICASLGYFSVLSAANALSHYKSGKHYACEWYSHMCNCKGQGFFDESTLLEIGGDVVLSAIRQRHRHSGYMQEYQMAIQLVNAELKQKGFTSDMLASWF